MAEFLQKGTLGMPRDQIVPERGGKTLKALRWESAHTSIVMYLICRFDHLALKDAMKIARAAIDGAKKNAKLSEPKDWNNTFKHGAD